MGKVKGSSYPPVTTPEVPLSRALNLNFYSEAARDADLIKVKTFYRKLNMFPPELAEWLSFDNTGGVEYARDKPVLFKHTPSCRLGQIAF